VREDYIKNDNNDLAQSRFDSSEEETTSPPKQ
jgi:hypothetical protein